VNDRFLAGLADFSSSAMIKFSLVYAGLVCSCRASVGTIFKNFYFTR